MARKPAPTALKVIRGDRESRINREEPVPSDGDVIVAPEMSVGGREVWDSLASDLADKGCLTSWDVYTFAAFCEAVAKWRECRKLLEEHVSDYGKYVERGAAGGVIKSPYHQIMRDCEETMAKFSSRFGLTPADRASLKIERGQDNGPKQGAERILG